MTDEASPAEKILAFFKRRNVSGACPMCGTKGWSLTFDKPYSRLYITDQENGGDISEMAFFPAYMLRCNNCGFVALHMKHVVDEPEDRDNKDSDDEQS